MTVPIAHRGDPVAFRENTIDAVLAGWAAGAGVVEVDVKTTLDGVSVLLHDDTLERLWGDPRDIRSLTWDEVEQVSASAAPQRIPRLAEVLALLAEDPSRVVMIDFDNPEYADAAVDEVAAAVGQGSIGAAQVMWCGNHDGLRRVRAADEDARIVLSWGPEHGPVPGEDGYADTIAELLRPELLNPAYVMIDAGMLQWSADRGIPLSCWTVDDPTQMRRLRDLGVAAMISNRIHELVAVLAEPQR